MAVNNSERTTRDDETCSVGSFGSNGREVSPRRVIARCARETSPRAGFLNNAEDSSPSNSALVAASRESSPKGADARDKIPGGSNVVAIEDLSSRTLLWYLGRRTYRKGVTAISQLNSSAPAGLRDVLSPAERAIYYMGTAFQRFREAYGNGRTIATEKPFNDAENREWGDGRDSSKKQEAESGTSGCYHGDADSSRYSRVSR